MKRKEVKNIMPMYIVGGIINGAVTAGSKGYSTFDSAKETDENGNVIESNQNVALATAANAISPFHAGMNALKNKERLGLTNAEIIGSFVNPSMAVRINKKEGEYANKQAAKIERDKAVASMMANQRGANANIPTFEMGGQMQSSEQLDNIEGQLHEQGGTNIGNKAEAQKGETKKDKYIYSDDIKVTKKMAKDYDMPNSYIGMSMAEISKKVQNKYGKRKNDTLDEKVLNEELDILRDVQEEAKQKMASRAMNVLQQVNPNMLPKMVMGGGIADPPFTDVYDWSGQDNETGTGAAAYGVKPNYLVNPKDNSLLQYANDIDTKKYSTMPVLNVKPISEVSAMNTDKNITGLTGNQMMTKAGTVVNQTGTGKTKSGKEETQQENGVDKADFWMQNMGNVFDIVRGTQGLLKKDKKFDRMTPTLTNPALVDPQTAIQEANNAYNQAADVVRQNSMGLGNYLSNRISLAANKAREIANIRSQYDQANSGIINQNRAQNAQSITGAQQVNIDQSNLEERVNQQERDVSANMIQGALANAGEIYASTKKDANTRRMDRYALQYLGSTDYYFITEGNNTYMVRRDTGQRVQVDPTTMQRVR